MGCNNSSKKAAPPPSSYHNMIDGDMLAKMRRKYSNVDASEAAAALNTAEGPDTAAVAAS